MKWRVAVASLASTVAFAGVVATVDAAAPDITLAAAAPDITFAAPSDTLSVLATLQSIRVENENSRGYRRTLFKHWEDVDGDGCNAREQVLKRDAVGLPQVDPFRCFVVEADWVSPYDGKATSDRTQVDIDHVVALKEAWDSGAWRWTEAQRTAYANDTSDSRTLLAVSSSSNRSKGEKDPSNWLPPASGYVCTYVANWISVKARWNLSMDQSEWGRLNNLLSGQCAGTTMRGWNPTPVAVSRATGTATPALATTPAGSESTVASTIPSRPISTIAPTATTEKSLTPGSFCAPEGALGTLNGIAYICAKTDANGVPYSKNRARWRRQN